MLNPGELLQKCEELQRSMERNVFEFPPTDWAAFQNRLGQWQGSERVRDFIESVMEEEKRKDDKL